MSRLKQTFRIALVAAGLCMLTSTVLASDKDLPETTKDGLELKKNDRHSALYVKPGASLEAYERVTMTDVYVAFQKNWQRDYNSTERDLGGRISDEDMEKIKNWLADEFKKVFTEELKKAGHDVVDGAAADVLLLRPAIVNLDVNAPDVRKAGMQRTYVASAGSMTLYMELYDSVSSDKLAEVIDAEGDRESGIAHMGGRVTNRAAADRILRDWAQALIKHMGEALD